jgi:hypothetical protein
VRRRILLLIAVRSHLKCSAAAEYEVNSPLLIASTALVIAADLSALAMIKGGKKSIFEAGF